MQSHFTRLLPERRQNMALGRFHSEFYPLIRDTGEQSFKKRGNSFRRVGGWARVRRIPDGPIGAVWFRRGRIHSQAMPTDFSGMLPLAAPLLAEEANERKDFSFHSHVGVIREAVRA